VETAAAVALYVTDKGRRAAYKLYAKTTDTGLQPNNHTYSPSLPFNDLHTRNPCNYMVG